MKKRGFTMVELLAAIVILGILSILAIVSVSRLIDKSKDEEQKQKQNILKMAAQAYMQDNPEKLPKLIGDSRDLTAQFLKNKKYLKEDIKNKENKSCMANSFVRVIKKSTTKYTYEVHILCGNDTFVKEENNKPTIDIYFVDSLGTEIEDLKEVFKNPEKDSLYIKMTGGVDIKENKPLKLAGYSFAVYATINGKEKEVYNSGTISAEGKYEAEHRQKLSTFMDITTITDFNIKVTAFNEKGKKEQVEKGKRYNDEKLPFCSGISGEAAANEWINRDEYNRTGKLRYITAVCKDVGSSGCVRKAFTRAWPDKDNPKGAEWGYIQVVDNAGNKNVKNGSNYLLNPCVLKADEIANTCRVRVNVDIENPSIKVTSSSLNGVYESSDSLGNKTITSDKHINNVRGWLNKNNYSQTVTYNVELSDNLHLDSYVWETNPQNIKETSAANYSTLKETNANAIKETNIDSNSNLNCGNNSKKTIQVSLSGEGLRQGRLTVYDKARNYTQITIKANFDRKAPTCTVTAKKSISKTNKNVGLETYDDDSWSNVAKVYVTPKCTDVGASKCSSEDYYVKVTRGASSSAIVGTFYESTRGLESEGTSYHDWTIYDKAGNSTACPRFTIKLDRTAPSCDATPSADATDGIVISYACSDNLTAFTCPQKTPKIAVEKTVEAKAKDEVGNTKNCNVKITKVKQYKKRTRTWNSCKTGSPKTCTYGCDRCKYNCKKCCYKEGSYICDNWECRASSETCQYKNCNCSSCHHYTNTCKGGWNDWSNWSSSWRDGTCTESNKVDCTHRYVYRGKKV